MNCSQAAPYLPASPDELDATTEADLREHVAGCAACRAESRRYDGIRAALSVAASTELDPPPDLVPAIVARTSGHPSRRTIPLLPIPPVELARVIQDNREVIVGAAGAAIVAAGAAWALWRGLRSVRRTAPQQA